MQMTTWIELHASADHMITSVELRNTLHDRVAALDSCMDVLDSDRDGSLTHGRSREDLLALRLA